MNWNVQSVTCLNIRQSLRSQLREFRSQRNIGKLYFFPKEIQSKLQAGEILLKLTKENVGFQQESSGNPLLTEYFSKQQQLGTYVADLERIIFKPLNELL